MKTKSNYSRRTISGEKRRLPHELVQNPVFENIEKRINVFQ